MTLLATQLVARTTPLDPSGVDLLAVAGGDGFAWERDGSGLAGHREQVDTRGVKWRRPGDQLSGQQRHRRSPLVGAVTTRVAVISCVIPPLSSVRFTAPNPAERNRPATTAGSGR